MQSSNKVTPDNFSLVIINNDTLLKSVKDYFYQNLLHDFDETRVFNCSINNINQTLQQIQTEYVLVIQEGIFFFDHVDNNFLKITIKNLEDYVLIGHVLDRKDRYYQLHPQQFILNVNKWKQIGSPDFNCRSDNNLSAIKRSDDNFHDDYTPTWIQASDSSVSCEKLKFGGFVISLGLVAGWLPLTFSVALTGLEILVAFLQAYVFAILTCIYLNDALNLHH